MSEKRILILEDEMIIALDIRTMLERLGYSVVGMSATVEEAISIMKNSPVDLMIVDFRLHGSLNGEEAASAIRSHFNQAIPIIFLSGTADLEIRNRLAVNPCAFLKKPVKVEELIECIQSILKSAT